MLMGFLKEAEKCNYSATLVSLRLIGNFGKTLYGQGEITWGESGVSIQAQTNGGPELQKSMFGPQQKIGEILPDEFYFRLEGETQDGQVVTISRVMPHNFHTHFGKEHVDWNFGQHELLDLVKVTEKINDEIPSATTEFFLSPEVIDTYPRRSKPNENQLLGKPDRLQIQCKLGLVSAQKRESETIHCEIKHDSQIKLEQLNAIQSAIAFMTGRPVGFRAVEIRRENEIHRYFGWRSPKCPANRMSSPIGLAITSIPLYEKFLSKLTDYFLTPRGVNVAGFIYACHDSIDNSFTTNAMVVCAVLEGMLKPYTKELVVSSGLTADDKGKVVAFRKESEFPEKVVKRLEGFMTGMESPSVDQVMRNWIDDGFLDVSTADHKAWKSLRNPAMHGTRLVLPTTTSAKIQKRVDEMGRLTNLINKLIMFEAGYFDRYHDCSLHQERELHEPSEKKRREHWIAEAAYFRWINSGMEHGKDLENWEHAVCEFNHQSNDTHT